MSVGRGIAMVVFFHLAASVRVTLGPPISKKFPIVRLEHWSAYTISKITSRLLFQLINKTGTRPGLLISSGNSTFAIKAHAIRHRAEMTAAVPRPPLGYSSMAVSAEEIVLQLTISNKCGQAFRWRGIDVYEYEEDSALHFTPDTKHSPYIKQNNVGNETTDVKTEPSSSRNGTFSKITEWSLCLDDRVVFVRQDTARGYLYYRTLLGDNAGGSKTYAMNSALIEEETRLWLRDYLNLDFPLDDKYNEWSKKDPVFALFAKRFSGARILRQDPWECLCS